MAAASSSFLTPVTSAACDVEWARQYFLEVCWQPAHIVIKEALSKAGFEVRNIQKHGLHHCWEVRMRRGTATLAAQPREAVRQVRRVLADAGVNVERDAISLDRSGERIHVAFIYDGGQEGFWC
jgi:hypothetical protein